MEASHSQLCLEFVQKVRAIVYSKTFLAFFSPFFSAKAMASSLEEKESIMLDKGSALKERRRWLATQSQYCIIHLILNILSSKILKGPVLCKDHFTSVF